MGNGDIHLYRNKKIGHLFRIMGLSRLEISMKGGKGSDDLR